MINTAVNFARRVGENRKVARGVIPAAALAVRQRLCRDRDTLFEDLAVEGLPFVARYRDWLGVREVVFEEEYSVIRDVLGSQRAPVVIDGGANIGMFSLYVLAHYPGARVTSYEASASTFSVLAANKALNPQLSWSVHCAALWRANEPVAIHETDWSTSSKVGTGAGTNSVPGKTIDAVLAESGEPVDLMKIDIEGAEESFLCPAPERLAGVAHLLVELHPKDCDADAVIEVLRRRWRQLYRVPGRTSSKPLVLATDKAFDLPAFQA